MNRLTSFLSRLTWPARHGTEAERVTSTVTRALRSFGMPRALVRTLAADLRSELAAAAEAGSGQEAIVGGDARAFAARLAEAHGYTPVPLRLFGLTAAALFPMAAIAFIVYVVIAGGGPNLGLPYMTVAVERNESNRAFLDAIGEGWFIAATYTVAVLLGLTLTLGGAAAYLAVRGDTCVGRTVRNLAIGMPIGAFAGTAIAMAVGRATDYSDNADVIAVECVIVAAAITAGIFAARQLARRRPRGVATNAPSVAHLA